MAPLKGYRATEILRAGCGCHKPRTNLKNSMVIVKYFIRKVIKIQEHEKLLRFETILYY